MVTIEDVLMDLGTVINNLKEKGDDKEKSNIGYLELAFKLLDVGFNNMCDKRVEDFLKSDIIKYIESTNKEVEYLGITDLYSCRNKVLIVLGTCSIKGDADKEITYVYKKDFDSNNEYLFYCTPYEARLEFVKQLMKYV